MRMIEHETWIKKFFGGKHVHILSTVPLTKPGVKVLDHQTVFVCCLDEMPHLVDFHVIGVIYEGVMQYPQPDFHADDTIFLERDRG